jgi:hypothetical protein
LVKHYSKPGAPILTIDAKENEEDKTKADITIRAKKGSDGENNPARGVQVKYYINGEGPITEPNEPSENNLKDELTIQFSTDIGNLKLITAYAKTYGTENRKVYTDNTLTT